MTLPINNMIDKTALNRTNRIKVIVLLDKLIGDCVDIAQSAQDIK